MSEFKGTVTHLIAKCEVKKILVKKQKSFS